MSKHIWILFLLFFSLSCGKVTQEISESKETPSFKLSFTIPVTSEEKPVSSNFSMTDTVYTAVFAYTDKFTRKSLSWGKAVVDVKEVVETKPENITENETVSGSVVMASVAVSADAKPLYAYTSKAFSINGRENKSGADHTVSYLELNSKKQVWAVSNAKLRKGFSGYLASFFTEADTYALKWVVGSDVSGNQSLNFQELSDYDTFLGVLQLMLVQDERYDMDDYDLFVKVFTYDVFKSLNYTRPSNEASKFNYEEPYFVFKRPLEILLLDIWEFVKVDFQEAVSFIENLDEKRLSEPSKDALLVAIQLLIDPVMAESENN